MLSVADPRGGTYGGCAPPFGLFSYKQKFASKKIVINEYEIYRKMLEMDLRDPIFQKCLEEHAPRPP